MCSSYRSIVLGVFLIFGAATASSQSTRQDQLPPATPQARTPIQLSVTVTNKKEFVTGLSQDSFQITVDKVPAKIVRFSNSDLPVSVGVLLDVSGSMQRLGRRLRVLQEALSSFTSRSNSSNEYFLIGFNERAQLLTDWTSKSPIITEDILSLKPFGGTAFFDACYLAMTKLQDARHSRRVLILISDGEDNKSRYSFNDLQKLTKQTGTLVYAIHFAEHDLGTSLGMEGQGILYELTVPSGGEWYEASALKPLEAIKVFESIADALRSQYTLAVEPPVADKKWHRIRLKVTVPTPGRGMKSLSARTREGFYAPQNPIKSPQP